MNGHEKDKIMMATRNLCSICNSYYDIINEQLANEECKLDNIPENLNNSELYSQLEDSIDELTEVSDTVEEIQDLIDSIPSVLGFTYRKEKKKRSLLPPNNICRQEKTY